MDKTMKQENIKLRDEERKQLDILVMNFMIEN